MHCLLVFRISSSLISLYFLQVFFHLHVLLSSQFSFCIPFSQNILCAFAGYFTGCKDLLAFDQLVGIWFGAIGCGSRLGCMARAILQQKLVSVDAIVGACGDLIPHAWTSLAVDFRYWFLLVRKIAPFNLSISHYAYKTKFATRLLKSISP